MSWEVVAIRLLKWLNVGLDAAYEAIEAGPGAMVATSDELHAVCADIGRWVVQNPRSTEVDWLLVKALEESEQLATMWAEQASGDADTEAMKAQWIGATVAFVQALCAVRGDAHVH